MYYCIKERIYIIIKDPLVLSKSLVLKNVALKMRIKDSVEIYVTGGLTLPNVDQVGFTGLYSSIIIALTSLTPVWF